MKITLVNTLLKGGASKSAQRLYNGLKLFNHETKFLVKNNIGSDQCIISEFETFQKSNKFRKIVKYLDIKLQFNEEFGKFLNIRSEQGLDKFSLPYSNCKIYNSEIIKNSDLINLHWVAEFLDFKSFFGYIEKPVIWTLHDEFPFSVGEHYIEHLVFNEFSELKPRVKSDFEKKVELKLRESKLKIFEKVDKLTIVGPSQWICEQSRSSELFSKYDTYNIPYGVNTDIFKFWDKDFAKRFFNIPNDCPSILFVADNINENRKGIRLLLSALNKLEGEKLNLLVVGSGEININIKDSTLKLYRFGRINDERIISLIYNAADYFVIPSIMDNLPNTAIESICCGTPVIGFRVGGIPDIVSDGVNGYLSDKLNSENLAEVILKGIRNVNSFDNVNISKEAIKKYPLELQARRYIDLFKNVI